jgi:hypothetical protein
MSAERIYLVETPVGVRLVKASARSQALSHVAQSQFHVRVASQDDLVQALTDGVRVENYRNPDQQNLDLGAE